MFLMAFVRAKKNLDTFPYLFSLLVHWFFMGVELSLHMWLCEYIFPHAHKRQVCVCGHKKDSRTSVVIFYIPPTVNKYHEEDRTIYEFIYLWHSAVQHTVQWFLLRTHIFEIGSETCVFFFFLLLINSLQLTTVVFNNTYSQITHYFFFFLNPFRRLFSAVDYSMITSMIPIWRIWGSRTVYVGLS